MSEFVPDAELEMVLEADGSSGSVANNLTTTEEGYVLDARQGPAIVLLLNGKVDLDKIVNNLTTTAAGYVLDARQGKALKDAVDGKLPLTGGTLTGSLSIYNGEGYSDLKVVRDYGQNKCTLFSAVASDGSHVGVIGFSINDDDVNRMYLFGDRTVFTQPVVISSGGTGATTAAGARKNLGAVSMRSQAITLPASGWYTNGSGNIITDNSSISNLVSSDNFIIAPDAYSSVAYNEHQVVCHSAANGKLSFWARSGVKPTVDLIVNVLMLREG